MPPPPQPDRFVLRWIAFAAILIFALGPVVYRLTWRETAAPEGGPTGDNVVVIQYMAWGNPQQLETERTIIRRFNQHCLDTGQPLRVDLFVTTSGGYVEKLLTMIAGNDAPDVVRVDHFQFASIAGEGFFYDLTDLARSDPTFHPQDFHPAAMRENYYHGHFYGLNMLFGGVICYYNKDLFRRAGLGDPYDLWRQGKWNWETFNDDCTRLATRDSAGRPTCFALILPDAIIGYPAAPHVVYWNFWLWPQNGQCLNDDYSRCLLDSPNSLRAITDMRSMVYGRRVVPSPSDAANGAFSFESGNVAMRFDFAGLTPGLRDTIRDFQWDIVPTPSPANDPFSIVKGNQLVISVHCQHPRQAWEWIKFLTSEESEMYLCGDSARREIPTRLSVLHSPQFLHASQAPFHTDVFSNLLAHPRELPIDESWPTWTLTAQKFMDHLFHDESADTADTMAQAARAIDVDLAQTHARYLRYRQNEVSDVQ